LSIQAVLYLKQAILEYAAGIFIKGRDIVEQKQLIEKVIDYSLLIIDN